MIESYESLKQIIDTLAEHIVVIDREGNILLTNHSWRAHQKNDTSMQDDANYLNDCDKAAAMGDEFKSKAANGIRSVIDSEKELFELEYPCFNSNKEKWFLMNVKPFTQQDTSCFVISHQDITERKIAEEKVQQLSRTDSLTDIPNRKYFDEFMNDEWERCNRLSLPITFMIIDIDHFKLLNETYGQEAGDESLKNIGCSLKKLVNRPGDLCARYGDKEFAIVYGNINSDQSKYLASKVLQEIRSLNIPNEKSPTASTLTISVGLATIYPNKENCINDLITEANRLLSLAKKNGRNQVCIPSSHSTA